MSIPALSPNTIEEFLEALRLRGLSEKTVETYNTPLTSLLRNRGVIPHEQLENETRRWLNAIRRQKSARTVRTYMSGVKSYASWAGLKGFLEDYVPPGLPQREADPLPGGLESVDKMIEACQDPREVAFVVLTCRLGARLSEALGVGPNDFKRKYRDDGPWWFVTVHGKGDRDRTIPLMPELYKLLQPAIRGAEYRRDGRLIPWTAPVAKYRFKKIGWRALGVDVHTHQGRATVGTGLAERGVDIEVIQDILGHSSIDTTRLYVSVSPKRKLDAMRKVI